MSDFPIPCVRCGEPIPAERLETVPETQVCVRCSQEMGGEFKVYVVAERISKEGSLKKNYGGYSAKKVRKPISPRGE